MMVDSGSGPKRGSFKPLAAIGVLALAALGCEDEGAREAVSRHPADQAVAPTGKPGNRSGDAAVAGTSVVSIADPRMRPLIRAAEIWKQSSGPSRRIVDQVYLVPDETSFLEAIAAWDESNSFPILIDDPAWSLPFLRAFRPSRVVRFRPDRARTGPDSRATDEPLLRWAGALRAVSRAWSREGVAESGLPSASRAPRHLGITPPGVVLSDRWSPTLAAAVALAAGHFQPLVEFVPTLSTTYANGPGERAPRPRFADVLPLADARAFARQVERRVEEVVGSSRQLGDACDFLTLAGDWPYRYRNDVERDPIRGDAALDDLIGRTLSEGEGTPATSRGRWAYAGRILGDPAASVYRAMCALFLEPEETLLWNTYGGNAPWSNYRMTEAARVLGRLTPGHSPPALREGDGSSLLAWHQTVDPASRFGWFLVNSSGMPRDFSIPGGPGRPSDLPRGRPAAVVIIHSHSAADPLDPSTIAGRWLENGAFVYYGSMNEPFLHAFRTPQLVVELAATGMPLAAAVRQDASEPFGRPWRLAYLGDPLYALGYLARGRQPREGRLAPGPWTPLPSAKGSLAGTVIFGEMPAPTLAGGDSERLESCLTAALAALCRGGKAPPAGSPWLAGLLAINRRALEARDRERRDELTIDTLLHAGAPDRLLGDLLAIPPADACPRAERMLETLLMARVTRLAYVGSTDAALDLWDTMIGRPWSAGSEFPAHLTLRLSGLSATSPGFRDAYLRHLKRADSVLAGNPEAAPRRDLVRRERARLDVVLPGPSR